MYEGRFIGGLPFAEALQHPLKAVHRLLRRCDLHLPAGGEYPAVEIAAEINGRLHSEVVLVHNLRGSILPEAVDDADGDQILLVGSLGVVLLEDAFLKANLPRS